MIIGLSEMDAASRLAIAALIGLGVGVEREWSGHARGRDERFAGMRTFLLLGVLGGCAGLLLDLGQQLAAGALMAGGAALAVASYAFVVRRPDSTPDGTTEAAALVVIALGGLAGLGWLALASATAAVIVLALSEKERLHRMVSHVRADELRAALRFSILALVILPLLPQGPIGGVLQIRPRSLWIIVLFFSALNFVGFVVRRGIGAGRGFGVLGMLGGLISSTAVTFDFSRRSKREPNLASPLAAGVVGACTVLVPRVLVVSGTLNPDVALSLIPLLGVPALLGLWIVLRSWRASRATAAPEEVSDRNPLRLALALQMAVAFQISMTLIDYVRAHWATPGMYATAVALGLTDVDALTVGMSRQSGVSLSPEIAARAIAMGIVANTLFKLGLSLALGDRNFRRSAGLGLAGMAAAGAVGLWLL